MKIKVTKSYFEESTGTSVVTVTSPLGEFTGYAYFNDEDRKADPRIMSRYEGCLIAEIRARIMALKAEYKKISTELNVLNELQYRAAAIGYARNESLSTSLKPYNTFMAMQSDRAARKDIIYNKIEALKKALPEIVKDYYNNKKKSLAVIDNQKQG